MNSNASSPLGVMEMGTPLTMAASRTRRTVLEFPPGFRFHPSDEELIVHYLHKKATLRPLPAPIVAEIDLYKYNPWELPKKALFGEVEWFFFSPRDRKYPKGVRPNRAAGSGYWKATGIDKPIFASGSTKRIGVKKALVFYIGRPQKGMKTGWTMSEYRLLDPSVKPQKLKGSMRLDDWVLCRVQQKECNSRTMNGRHKGFRNNAPPDSSVNEGSHIISTHLSNITIEPIYEDWQVMASMLAGQVSCPFSSISSMGFQGPNGNNSLDLLYNGNPDILSSSTTSAFIHSHAKTGTRDQLQNALADRDVYLYTQNQCHETVLNYDIFSVLNFADVSDLSLLNDICSNVRESLDKTWNLVET